MFGDAHHLEGEKTVRFNQYMLSFADFVSSSGRDLLPSLGILTEADLTREELVESSRHGSL